MKKLAILSLFLCLGIQSQSQVLITLLLGDKLNSEGLEFGLEGGVNGSNLNGLETRNPLVNFNLGFYFDILIKENWYVYTGCLVKSNMGVAKLTDNDLIVLDATKYEGEIDGILIEGNYSQEMNYFLVPALIKYRWDNRFYVEGGAQFGLMYKSWIQFESDIDGRDATIKEFNTDDLNSFDFGVAGGLGYKLMGGAGWTLGLRYYYGFVDVYRDIPNSNNSGLFAKLNIPIGAGKAKEKAETKKMD
jgi:hypothetical protein